MRILATLLSLLCVSSLTLGQLRPVMSKRSPELEDVRRRLAELKMDSLDLSEIGASTVAVRELSSGDTRELSGIGAMVAAGEPDAFIQSYSSLAALRKSGHVIEIGRFSDSPSISDLATLTIEANDLYALWKATPGDSQIKLSETEIKQIRTVVNGNRFTEPIRQRLSAEYKQVLAKRMSDYINKGSLDSVSYADKEERVNAEQTFETLAREQAATPGICSHLASLWTGSSAPVFHSSSFCYWAKERFGELKPVINLIQVIIHFEGARTYLVSKQIYSSHYTQAGLSVAEFIPLGDRTNQPRTLVLYTIRMELDMLGGTLGFLKRRMAEPRVLATLKDSLNGLRLNMEAANSNRVAGADF